LKPDVLAVLPSLVLEYGEPLADSSAIPTYYVSEMARRHVTVALSGDGGDEVFGGYDFRYVPHALEDIARGLLPGEAVRAMAAWIGRHWPRTNRLPRAFRLGSLLENVGRDPAAAYFHDLCFLKPDRVKTLRGLSASHTARDSAVYAAVTGAYRRCPSPSALQRAQYADVKIYLPNDVLVKVDRMSMQHALEVRCPFLDRRVVEFGFRIPTRTKMPRLSAKHLLKNLAVRRLPPAVVHLPKHGFTAPAGAWLTGPYADVFLADTCGSDAFVADVLDTAVVRRAFNDHRCGISDESYLLWAVWMLERWGRRWRYRGREKTQTGEPEIATVA
jgi:asparagine synthase (glutamine-hydrolysing)